MPALDDSLAQHIAHLHIRDPLVIFKERVEVNDAAASEHFESTQSTNWQVHVLRQTLVPSSALAILSSTSGAFPMRERAKSFFQLSYIALGTASSSDLCIDFIYSNFSLR